MGVRGEFATIDLILGSRAQTRGVDAFSLALIKAERQARKLFTHLVFQSPAFTRGDVSELRDTLAENRKVYLAGTLRGIDAISPLSVAELVGARYTELKRRLEEATVYRNKIFHGQLTSKRLGRRDLIAYVNDIRDWCLELGNSAKRRIGFDGFGTGTQRSSFRKSSKTGLRESLHTTFDSVEQYRTFITNVMQQPQGKTKRGRRKVKRRRRMS